MRVAKLLVIAVLGSLGSFGSGACVRDSADKLCPNLAVGDLVITEMRGPQSPEDLLGPWVEIYNANGQSIDLLGITVRLTNTDGLKFPLLVRRDLEAAAGSYTVLGLFDDTDPPNHVDYGVLGDLHVSWVVNGGISVESCGLVIDNVAPYSLPTMGTYSLGGAPSADRNDLPAAWCTDDTLTGTTTHPGTPQGANFVCP